MANDAPQNESEKRERNLTRMADHLSDFGTLTSLGTTGFYFVEKALNKELPKHLNTFSLIAVAVGMGAVLTSFGIRYKAGKIALENDRHQHEAAAQQQQMQR